MTDALVIEMHTELHAGIYRSERERVARDVPEYPLTVKGVRRALIDLQRRKDQMRRAYGDGGSGLTYLRLSNGASCRPLEWVLPTDDAATIERAVTRLRAWAALTHEEREAMAAAEDADDDAAWQKR